ncbi:hypothetical protein ACFW2Y_17205 [Streptomyces sp. NPDC058877]|uniref:hypothetical protein n=1 Tax=Streptomyces sp. NPDC058877 TaxID=3346665 RepID=UPI0036BF5477
MLEPLPPKHSRTGRLPTRPRQQLIDGMRFRVRAGVPWRDVLVEYGPWRPGPPPVPPVTAERHLATSAHPAPVPDRGKGRHHVGPERLLHGLPRSPACGWCSRTGRPAAGTAGPHSHRTARSRAGKVTRGSFTTKPHLAVAQRQAATSIVVTAGHVRTHRSTNPCRQRSARLASARARASAQTACGPTSPCPSWSRPGSGVIPAVRAGPGNDPGGAEISPWTDSTRC